MSACDVSVVISVKNRERLLLECLRGLAVQSLGRERFEVVLIDNLSDRPLAELAERARAELGLTIQYRRTTDDHGPAPARNLGVALARAPIIAFTDSDCRPEPGWLAAGLAAFADTSIALVTGPILPKPEQVATLTVRATFARAEHPTFPTANAFYRRSIFRQYDGFDETLSFRDLWSRATECADADLAWRIIKGGHARRFIPEALIYHQVDNQDLMLWVVEPTRLFVVPALVRRHPELRSELLTARLFFYSATPLLYLGVVVVLLGFFWEPWLLLSLPVMLVGRVIQRTGSLQPVALARTFMRTVAHLPRMLMMSIALLYGSARFRCLVL